MPEERRDDPTIVFFGEDYLQGDDITGANLQALFGAYSENGTEPPWEMVGQVGDVDGKWTHHRYDRHVRLWGNPAG